jgi:Carbohydrate-binding module 48 (Isoamylase N-terminal domain)
MFDAYDDLDQLPASLATALRRDVRPAGGRDAAIAAIMDAVQTAPPPVPHSARASSRVARFLSLRPMRPRWSLRRGALSPAGALLATCLTVAVGWLGALGGQRGATPRPRAGGVMHPVATTGTSVLRDSLLDNAIVLAIRDTVRMVRFALEAPGASRVALVGDFNGWNAAALPLRRVAGAWAADVPLRSGRHRFGFVVDDTGWIGEKRAASHALAVDTLALAPARVPGDTI